MSPVFAMNSLSDASWINESLFPKPAFSTSLAISLKVRPSGMVSLCKLIRPFTSILRRLSGDSLNESRYSPALIFVELPLTMARRRNIYLFLISFFSSRFLAIFCKLSPEFMLKIMLFLSVPLGFDFNSPGVNSNVVSDFEIISGFEVDSDPGDISDSGVCLNLSAGFDFSFDSGVCFVAIASFGSEELNGLAEFAGVVMDF